MMIILNSGAEKSGQAEKSLFCEVLPGWGC